MRQLMRGRIEGGRNEKNLFWDMDDDDGERLGGNASFDGHRESKVVADVSFGVRRRDGEDSSDAGRRRITGSGRKRKVCEECGGCCCGDDDEEGGEFPGYEDKGNEGDGEVDLDLLLPVRVGEDSAVASSVAGHGIGSTAAFEIETNGIRSARDRHRRTSIDSVSSHFGFGFPRSLSEDNLMFMAAHAASTSCRGRKGRHARMDAEDETGPKVKPKANMHLKMKMMRKQEVATRSRKSPRNSDGNEPDWSRRRVRNENEACGSTESPSSSRSGSSESLSMTLEGTSRELRVQSSDTLAMFVSVGPDTCDGDQPSQQPRRRDRWRKASVTFKDDHVEEIQETFEFVRGGVSSHATGSELGFEDSSTISIDQDDLASIGALELLAMPEELVMRMLCFVAPRDAVNVMSACRAFYCLCSENLFWRAMVNSKWPKDNPERGILKSKGRLRLTQRSMHICWRSYLREKADLAKREVTTWSPISRDASAPPPRFIHSGCVVGSKIFYIGGQIHTQQGRLAEIWALDTEAGGWEQIQASSGEVPPIARHSAVAIGDKIYVYGGYDGVSLFYGLFIFDTKTKEWISNPKTTGDVPAPRSNHSAVAIGTRMYVYGGSNDDDSGDYTILGDFYELETVTMEWRRLDLKSRGPSPRVGHRMAALGTRVYVFGGGMWSYELSWTQKLNELWIFDIVTSEWHKAQATGEVPRVCSYPFIFAKGHHLFLFGGQSTDSSQVTNNFYSFDTVTQVWSLICDGKKMGSEFYPGPRDMGSANLVGESIYLFGGYCGGAIVPPQFDLWKLTFAGVNFLDDPGADH